MSRSALRRLTFAVACLAVHAAVISRTPAAEPPAVRSPVSPQESLQHLVVQSGLKVELVAHEPNVLDPVEVRFDEDGRLWVVEMRDYPTATKDGPRSRVSVLEDRDGDGFYEAATVFADGLPYATGVQPWKGGAFITYSGKLVYMKDTDGDGRADVDETWFTGFAEGNTQLRANHPRLALDNHIYVASGLRGGKIVNHRQPGSKPVSISGMDFRFDPLTGACEAISGSGQFGLTFDDYGNRFICTNRNPAIHVVLEDWQLKKNPLYAPPAVVQDVAKAAEQSHVYPIGKSWTTSNLHAGTFTAACGLEIYRGDALPAEFRGNLFVCEPTGHLVHREIMRPKGVTFESTPAYEGVDFLASRDSWFSPVNLDVGPDGALYVVDMYRAVIEHPEWVPDELRNRPDQLFGNDKGRIYRIVPPNFQRPPAPKLSAKSSDSLVALLSHSNAWWRETAARLLLERQDKRTIPRLRALAEKNESIHARIHAMWLLERLKRLDDALLSNLLRDANPRILEQVIEIADQRPSEVRIFDEHMTSGGGREISRSNEILVMACRLVDHDDARVRFNAFLYGGQMPTLQHPIDRWEQEAILISIGRFGGSLLEKMLENPIALKKFVDNERQFVAELARLAAAPGNDDQFGRAVDVLLFSDEFGRTGLTSLFAERTRRGSSFADAWSRVSIRSQRELDGVLEGAERDAKDSKLTDTTRCEAIDLLAVTDGATELFLPLALHDRQQSVRLRAIAALAKKSELKPWQQVLASYASGTPTLRSAILNGTLASPERIAMLFDEMSAGQIQPSQVDINHVNQLLQHRDKAIQARAKELFAAAVPQDRQKALDEYRPVLAMKADTERGRGIFTRHCATCHRIGDVGVNVAPDISDSREKSSEQILTDILQPNRAIDANYFSYTATTTEGVTHTGILAAETSTSVTLKEAEGKTITLRRDELDELVSSGQSLMPEGLERLIPLQDMADLVSFIKNWRYLDESPVIRPPSP